MVSTEGKPALCIFQICAAPVATKNSSGSAKHCNKAAPGKVMREEEEEEYEEAVMVRVTQGSPHLPVMVKRAQ